MITIGQILSRKRAEKKFTLEQVEKATRIRLKFLEALENDRFDLLPPGTFAKGLVKNYAAFIGVPVEEALAFYRRQTYEDIAKVMPEEAEPMGRKFVLTPPVFTALSVGVMLILFFGYLIVSYFKFAGAPGLEIRQPGNNSVTQKEQVEVVGKTDPDATLAINGQRVNTNQSGEFDIEIPLQPGLNTLVLTATNKFKKQTVVNRNVRLEKQ